MDTFPETGFARRKTGNAILQLTRSRRTGEYARVSGFPVRRLQWRERFRYNSGLL
jgi:hypothetical protein